MSDEITEESLETIRQDLERQRSEGEKRLLGEIHTAFFSEINYQDFETKILFKDYDIRKKFEDACLFIKESGIIETRYKIIKMILLIVAIETLMTDNFITFRDWLITSKEVDGKTEKEALYEGINISNFNQFKEKINALFEIYITHYGVTNKIRDFFIDYLTDSSKIKIIKSVRFKDKKIGEYVHKCFISKEICFSHNNYGKCYDRIEVCKLKSPESLNKVLKHVAGFIYGYYRNNFVHNGIQALVMEGNISGGFDSFNGKQVIVSLSYEDLKEIIIEGIKKFYQKEFN